MLYTRIVYLKLRSKKINAFALLTLPPVSYTLPNEAMENGSFEVFVRNR